PPRTRRRKTGPAQVEAGRRGRALGRSAILAAPIRLVGQPRQGARRAVRDRVVVEHEDPGGPRGACQGRHRLAVLWRFAGLSGLVWRPPATYPHSGFMASPWTSMNAP